MSAVFAVVIIGAALPYSPLAHDLGFTALPLDFFAVLVGMVALYLLLVEITKRRFFERVPAPAHPQRPPELRRADRLRRRGSRWVHHAPNAQAR
jgi:Mg2+-importing ATPase